MSVTVKIRNKDRLLAALKRKIPKVVDGLAAANVKSAQDIAASAQRLVPVGSGTLRDSIKVVGPGQRTPGGVTVPETGAMVIAGEGDAFYAPFVEFGTVNQPASPFLFPSYRIFKRRAKSRAGRAIGKAIRQG